MSTVRLPGLVDVHVHLRQPGGEHKETWDTGTAAALAGGITTVLAMPNTDPAVTDEETLDLALEFARIGARCDYAHFVGASAGNVEEAAKLADRAAGLKMYLGDTFGDLRLDDRVVWGAHLEAWPEDRTIAVHAEGEVLDDVLSLAAAMDRPIHICHVARPDDLGAISRARESGLRVTCEVTPHHLFLDCSSGLPPGRAEVRPSLGTPADRLGLWDRLEVVDCFATDHAPHTIEEKEGSDPPPGFPGVETMLPLFLTAVHDGRLTLDDLMSRLHVRPLEVYGLARDDETWVEVDVDARWTIEDGGSSKAGWSPYAGMEVMGRVERVMVRGAVAFEGGRVVAEPGTGTDLRRERRQ